jgi:hypothetical protein
MWERVRLNKPTVGAPDLAVEDLDPIVLRRARPVAEEAGVHHGFGAAEPGNRSRVATVAARTVAHVEDLEAAM